MKSFIPIFGLRTIETAIGSSNTISTQSLVSTDKKQVYSVSRDFAAVLETIIKIQITSSKFAAFTSNMPIYLTSHCICVFQVLDAHFQLKLVRTTLEQILLKEKSFVKFLWRYFWLKYVELYALSKSNLATFRSKVDTFTIAFFSVKMFTVCKLSSLKLISAKITTAFFCVWYFMEQGQCVPHFVIS